jgi:hypothetical protein
MSTREKKEGMYMIKSRSLFFLVTIARRTRDVYMVYVNAVPKKHSDHYNILKQKHCTEVQITTSPERESSGYITRINHDSVCSLVDTLPNGTGTREMVLSVLSLCSLIFGVTTFSLEDQSVFTCPHNKEEVDLMYHSLLVYGQTWYERKFDAVPRSLRHVLQNMKDTLSKKVDQEKADAITGELYGFSPEKTAFYRARIQDAVGNMTWNELFRGINSLDDGCRFFNRNVLSHIGDVMSFRRLEMWWINITDEIVASNLLAYDKILPRWEFV